MYSYDGVSTESRLNGVTLTRIVYILSYSLYLIFFMDSMQQEPVLSLNRYYSYIFPIFWLFVIFATSKMSMIRTENHAAPIIFAIYLFYILAALFSIASPMHYALPEELRACLKYITIVAVNVYVINNLNVFPEFIGCSFYTCGIYLIIRYAIAGFPLQAFANLSAIMSTNERFREGFGFYNVNAVGILSAGTIILSVLYLSCVAFYGKSVRGIRLILTVLIDVFVSIVLLSSGSRNSLLQVAIFVAAFIYLSITLLEKWSPTSRRILRVFMFILLVALIFSVFWASISDLFVSSLRFKTFQVNIPTFISSRRILQGMGLFNVGYFARSGTAYGQTVNIDNFYLYVLLETGIIGSCIMAYVLISIGVRLFQMKNDAISVSFFRLLCAAYISWLASGLGETCIIYHVFPSSLMLLTAFLTAIRMFHNKEDVIC